MFKSLLLVSIVIMLNSMLTLADFSIDTSSSAYYDLLEEASNIYADPTVPQRTCSSPGVMCKNCTTTVLCIDKGNGEFEEHAAENCVENDTCLETECVPSFNPQCSDMVNYLFPCDAVGVFPDQFNCRKFHMCVGTVNASGDPVLEDFMSECSNGYKFNAKTTYCDQKIVGNKCYEEITQFPVPTCTSHGAMDALKENPSIFYICEMYPGEGVLYPFLYLCPNGKIFDPKEMRCKDAV